MTRLSARALLPALLLAPLVASTDAARFGGWAVVTLDELPEYMVVGQPVTFAFMVRQHGHAPLYDLQPRLEARSGRRRVEVKAARAGQTGHYAATLALPAAGEWSITIHSGFGSSRLSLLPMRAVASRSSAPSMTPDERGLRLFVAKGCVTCHVHDAVTMEHQTVAVGPALTGRRFPPEYLARFLADPSIGPAARTSATPMPNLGLAPREIAALVAFVNADRPLSSRGRATGSR
jgi:mono/diheme cytochrome c family protein